MRLTLTIFFLGSIGERAIDKPVSVIWSDEFDITYKDASHIDRDSLKLKKKVTKSVPPVDNSFT